MKSIYVGNLPYTTNEDELKELFEAHGTVHSSRVIMDRETGRSRGFGFVEMDDGQADTAIQALNGQDFGGRSLKINEAKGRDAARPPRG
jgi:RNA recognition motif-containing protein